MKTEAHTLSIAAGSLCHSRIFYTLLKNQPYKRVQSSSLADRLRSGICKSIELLLGNSRVILWGHCLRSEEQQKRDHLLTPAKPQHRGWHFRLNQTGYVILWVGWVLSKWNIGMSSSATSATEAGRKKGQFTALIYIELANLLYARAGGMDISLFSNSEMAYVLRGPFPVSLELHPLFFSVYS